MTQEATVSTAQGGVRGQPPRTTRFLQSPPAVQGAPSAGAPA
jgi:hypothetical protein